MQNIPVFRGRLSFSLCFLENFRFATAFSVNFKKDLSYVFLADVSMFLAMWH
jgi:hypothetical protein